MTVSFWPLLSSQAVITDLETRVLPDALAAFPGVSYSFEGAQAEQRDVRKAADRCQPGPGF